MINKKAISIMAIGLMMAIGYLILMIWMKADLGDLLPENATSTTMYTMKRRILHYAKVNNRLPKTIEELPLLDTVTNPTTDYWGNKIIIHIEGNSVSLISYGKDKKQGGVGENLDVIGKFEAKTPSGRWADENDDTFWEKEPLRDKAR